MVVMNLELKIFQDLFKMKKVIIKSLSLRNFKGTIGKTIEFDEIQNLIQGDNRTGKTTIFDAFNFLFFGKNSQNSTKFSIKPLDAENNQISGKGIEHEVVGILSVDGQSNTYRRVYVEKWSKKRGSVEETKDGNTEFFYINDVPVSATEYSKEIDAIFNSSISRMITDPMYFNTVMQWQDRAKLLMSITGEITEQSVLDLHPELELIPSVFTENKTIEQKKKELSAKRLKVKESIEDIPGRLDEIHRMIHQELPSIEEVESDKKRFEDEISKNTALKNDLFKSNQAVTDRKIELNRQKNDIELEIQNERAELVREANSDRIAILEKRNRLHEELHQLKSKNERDQSKKRLNENNINGLREANSDLKAKYEFETNEHQFNVLECKCPSCNQSLPESEIESYRLKFNQEKAKRLSDIKQRAVINNDTIESLKSEIEQITNLDSEIENLQKQLDSLEIPEVSDSVPDNDSINIKLKQIVLLKYEIEEIIVTNQEDPVINSNIEHFNKSLSNSNDLLNKHKENERLLVRKSEIESQHKSLISELSAIEQFEYQLDQFNKFYMEAVEKSVNSVFNGVKFKMFEQQENGGEKPTCVCLVNGVPYPDVNTGGQIQAGLEIINVLQEYFQISTPVFIDNRETVSIIPQMNCQIINLKKVEGLTELVIN